MKLTLRHLAMALAGTGTIIATLTGPTPARIAPSEGPRTDPETHAPEKLIATLPSRPGLGKPHGDLFTPAARRPAPAPPSARVQAPPAPVPPPNPYRFAGAVLQDGKLRTLITDGNRIYEAHAGEDLSGGYRVDAVTPEEVVLVYRPLGSRHPIAAKWAFSPSAAPSFATASGAAPSVGSAPPLPPGSPLIAAAADPAPLPASPFPPGSPLTRPGS